MGKNVGTDLNHVSRVSRIIDGVFQGDTIAREYRKEKSGIVIRCGSKGGKKNVFGRVTFCVVQLAAVIILETPMYEPEPAINFVIVCVPNLMNIVKLILSPIGKV